jgi:type I restriction enzyme S subunit
VDKDDAYSMVRSAAMIRPNSNWLVKEYLALLLRSPYLQSQIRNRSKQSAQANLFLGAISNLVLLIPPLAEQSLIVAKVDKLFAICDALEERINESQVTQLNLADALVDGAVL